MSRVRVGVKYEHPAEFTLAEVAWIVASRQTEDLGMALGAATADAARQRWSRVNRAGGMTMTEADRFATRLGYHPANLWDGWFIRCAELDARYETWRRARRNGTRRRYRARVSGQVDRAAEHVEWVKWCDRRDRQRAAAEELTVR